MVCVQVSGIWGLGTSLSGSGLAFLGTRIRI